MKTVLGIIFAAAMLSSGTAAYAQSAGSEASTSDSMSTGEVKKVDKSAGKLTIKHGPLKNLGMDAMTMVFQVSDPAMLDQVKPGTQIDFVAQEPNGKLTVTKLVVKQ